jgi:hypothetical protein
MKDLLTRTIYAVLLLTYRIRPLAERVNSVHVPVNCA